MRHGRRKKLFLGRRAYCPLPPEDEVVWGSGSGSEFLEVVVVFVEVVADRNQKKLGADEIETSSSRSSVIAVLLHDPESSFRLDGIVQCSQCCISMLHESEQHRFQHVDTIIPRAPRPSVRARPQVLAYLRFLHELVKCENRVADV